MSVHPREFELDRISDRGYEIVWTPGDEYWGTILRRESDGRWIVVDDVGRPIVEGDFPDEGDAFEAFLDDL